MIGKKSAGHIGKLKNRVTLGKTRNLQAQLRLNTGVSQGLIISALTGDQQALKIIGQMGIEGARISEFAPKVKDQMIAAIQGQEDLNLVLSEIYKKAGVSGKAVERAIQSATLEDTSLVNALDEMKVDFDNSQRREELRHERTAKRLELKAWIDAHMTTVDEDYQLLKEELRIPIKQQTVNLQHDKEMGNYYLAEGNQAVDAFKPKKNYAGNNVVGKIKDFIFGF
jgi:hypothetical protein